MGYEQYNETVWGTYTFPFELMAPGMWLPAEPNNFGGNEKCVNGGNYWAGTGWALTTSPATSNSKTSSVSFPVKTEENTPTSLLKNNQSDLKDSIDYRLST